MGEPRKKVTFGGDGTDLLGRIGHWIQTEYTLNCFLQTKANSKFLQPQVYTDKHLVSSAQHQKSLISPLSKKGSTLHFWSQC